MQREGFVLREFDEKHRSGVVAGEGRGLGEEPARVEGADEVTDTLSLHTDIRSEDIVTHLARS